MSDIAAHFLPGLPTLSLVVSYWRSSLDVAAAASAAYTECVRAADGTNAARYLAALQVLVDAQALAMSDNDNATTRAVAAAEQCGALELSVLTTIAAWQQVGAALQFSDSDAQCSAAELEYGRLLVGDLNLGTNDSADASDVAVAPSSSSFLNTTDGLMDAAVASVDVRVLYDATYVRGKAGALQALTSELLALSEPFASVTLSGTLQVVDGPVDDVVQCVYGSEAAPALCSASLAQLYAPVVDGLQEALSEAQSGFAAALSQAAAFSEAAVDAEQSIAAFLSHLNGFEAALASIGVDVPVPSLPSLTPFVYVGDAAAAEAVVVVEDVDAVFARLFAPAEAAFRSAVAAVVAEALNAAAAFVAALQNASLPLPTLLADYDPPPVDLQLRAVALTAEASAATFVQRTIAALTPPANVTEADVDAGLEATAWPSLDEDGEEQDAANASLPLSASAAAALANANLAPIPSAVAASFVPFSGSVDVDGLVGSLTGFLGLFVALDYAFRAYRTLHILVAIARRPNDRLTPVDSRLHQEATTAPTQYALTYLALHPGLLALAVLVLAALSVYPLCLLYLRLLWQPYVQGCVDSGNGTLLTRNSAALFVNAASASGHVYALALTSAYDARAAADCAHYERVGLDNFLADALRLEQATARMHDAADGLVALSDCLSPASFNASALPPAISAASSALPSPFVALSASAVAACTGSAAAWSGWVVLAMLNCSALPQWSAPQCGAGASLPAISASTFDSGCWTEYAVHCQLLLLLCTALVFACQNVSRALIVAGLVRALWFHLCPDGLTALVNVGETGAMDSSARERMEWAVTDRIAKYRKQAPLFILSGLLAHAPYVAVLAALAYAAQGGIPAPVSG